MRNEEPSILHSSSLIPHPSFLIPHSSSLIPHPSFLIPHSSSLIPHPFSKSFPRHERQIQRQHVWAEEAQFHGEHDSQVKSDSHQEGRGPGPGNRHPPRKPNF